MIVDWLEPFMLRLIESYPAPPNPPHSWPDYGTGDWSAYFEDYRKAFARNGVSEAEAEEARSLMAEDPPRFRAEYIQKTIDAVKILREINPGGGGPVPDDRETAADDSKGCKHCFGQGLAIVYAPAPDPDKKIAPDVSAYCVCPLGRWIEKDHIEKSADVHKRTPDLANVLPGRSFWQLNPPGFDIPANRPAVAVAATIRLFTAAIGQESTPGPTPARPRPEFLGVREDERVRPATPTEAGT